MQFLPPCYLATHTREAMGMAVQVDLREGCEAMKRLVVAALGGAFAFVGRWVDVCVRE